MQPVLIAAYRLMLADGGCSVDRILEQPERRAEFLHLVRESVPAADEFAALHGLNNLRKRRKLPRRGDPLTAAT